MVSAMICGPLGLPPVVCCVLLLLALLLFAAGPGAVARPVTGWPGCCIPPCAGLPAFPGCTPMAGPMLAGVAVGGRLPGATSSLAPLPLGGLTARCSNGWMSIGWVFFR